MSGEDMYTDGRYLENNPSWDVEDAAWKSRVILQLIQSNGLAPGDVVEVGCGAGGILEQLSAALPGVKTLRGYDISPQAIGLAKKRETGRLRFSREDAVENEQLHTDLMLVIDVVEHVADYYGFLRKLKPKSGYFILHIPLDLSCRTVLKPHVLLQQREAVGHIHYFSREMVLWLLKDTGYTIIDWCYTRPGIDTGAPATFKAAIKKMLRALSFSVSKKRSVDLWGGYSMMILAK